MEGPSIPSLIIEAVILGAVNHCRFPAAFRFTDQEFCEKIP